jgi:hypothetical protein
VFVELRKKVQMFEYRDVHVMWVCSASWTTGGDREMVVFVYLFLKAFQQLSAVRYGPRRLTQT